jgi:aminopeptidase N
MKATYTFMAIVPRDWLVVANAPQVGSKSYQGSNAYKAKLESFSVDTEHFLPLFKDEQTCCFEFGESPKISTYLYCFIAGPYQVFESDVEEIRNFKVPLRVISRKSVAKYLENSKEDYFNTTKSGIEYYEQLFSCNYPFAKLD